MKKYLLLIVSTVLVFYSCNEDQTIVDEKTETKFSPAMEFQSNPDLQEEGVPQLKESIIDLQIILEKIIRQSDVSEEVFILGQADYYGDHYIGLSDLLNPEESDRYKQADMNSNIIGSFKNSFEKEIRKSQKMPNLKSYIERLKNENSQSQMRSTENTEDELDLYIYCPYCEDISEEEANNPTIAPTTVEASDKAPGNKLQENGEIQSVMVDDEYASGNLTYITTTANNTDVNRNPPEFDEPCPDYAPCCNDDPDCETGGGGGSGSYGEQTPPPILDVTDIQAGNNWPHPDENFIDYAIYDCGTDIAYTLPHNYYN